MKVLSCLLLDLSVMLYCNPFNSYDGDYDNVEEESVKEIFFVRV